MNIKKCAGIASAVAMLSACIATNPTAQKSEPKPGSQTTAAVKVAPDPRPESSKPGTPEYKEKVGTVGADPKEATPASGPMSLIGKTLVGVLPRDQNLMEIAFGNDYFRCDETAVASLPGVKIMSLRKGKKTECFRETVRTVAVTRSTKNYVYQVTDLLDVKVAKGYDLYTDSCQGADMVLMKDGKPEWLTKYVSAWKIVGGKFVPVNGKIKCYNINAGKS